MGACCLPQQQPSREGHPALFGTHRPGRAVCHSVRALRRRGDTQARKAEEGQGEDVRRRVFLGCP
eukprot:1064206-Prymnesium_polylepis.1